MAAVPDYFAFLGLSQAFAIDVQALDKVYREVQRRVHPDRFAGGSAPEQRQAAHWAALANEAYRTLKEPLQRARYLVQLRGVNLEDCAVPEAFLFTQLELREAVQKARADADFAALSSLRRSLKGETAELNALLAAQLDNEQDYQRAAQTVLMLQFFAKLAAEIEDAMLEVQE